MNFSILSSRLAKTRRDLANNSDKNQKFEKDMRQKIRLKNRISLLAFRTLDVNVAQLVDLWVRRTMYPSTYRCQNDHWRKISPLKNCSVLKKMQLRALRMAVDFVSFLENQSNFALQLSFAHNMGKTRFLFEKSATQRCRTKDKSNAYCKVTPYRLEKLGLLLHTSETRSLPRVATKRSTANSTGE